MADKNKGIIDPPIDELLSKVESKYALVIFASKRARQINDYYADLHEGSLFDNVGPLVDSTIDDKPLSEIFDIELDDDTHEAWKAGEPVSLSPTEFTLLRYLMVNAGTVLSKPRILDHVWNYDFGGEVNVVESYVSYLRRKIDTTEPRLLHTLRGVGYVLRQPRT